MTDVLLVRLGATAGLRASEDELAASLRRAGASVAQVTAVAPREVRTLVATDFSWALAARRAAVAGIASSSPRAVVYSTTTAALLWPRPGAIRFDALAAETRPGRHGLWQRPVEARRLRAATVLVPWTPHALPGPSVVVPMPVAPSGPPAAARDIAAITYGANWRKKGLDRVLAAWAAMPSHGDRPPADKGATGAECGPVAELSTHVDRPPADERATRAEGGGLVVAGIDATLVTEAWAAGGGRGALPASVRVTGPLAPSEYRALLRRARVFVTAPRREDYGIAQLEALADGCTLVTTAAPGPYAALPLARALDPRFVVEDGADTRALAQALRTALDATVSASGAGPGPALLDVLETAAGPEGGAGATYAARAASALAPFSRARVDAVVAEELLPRLLA